MLSGDAPAPDPEVCHHLGPRSDPP